MRLWMWPWNTYCRSWSSVLVMTRKGKRDKKTQQESGDGARTVATNRRARFQYHLQDHHDAGLQLHGTEIKSIRLGRVSLRDGFVAFRNGEAWLQDVHIAPYEFGNRQNHAELRPRKLLLHKREIRNLEAEVATKGLTVIPVRMYLNEDGRAKVEIALAKGKRLYDKRAAIAERESRRQMDRARKGAV